MRLFCFILLCSICSCGMAQKTDVWSLNRTGLPDYRKIVDINKATKVFTDGTFYSFEISENEVQKCINFDLKLKLNESQFDDLKTGELNYKISDSIIIVRNVLSIDIDSRRNYQFDLSFTVDSTNLKISNLASKKSNLGYVVLKNRFARYSTIQSPSSEKHFNIAIIDRNLDGLIDSNDIITVSYDHYFLVKPTKFGCFLTDSILLDFENELFLIKWIGGYNISITPHSLESNVNLRTIELNRKLFNFAVSEDGTNLKNIISSDKTIITFWASYCSPCIQAIPKLNEYKNNVVGFQADYADKNVGNLVFQNFSISTEMLGFLGINGFPNYMVVDAELNILYFGRFLDEALKYFQ